MTEYENIFPKASCLKIFGKIIPTTLGHKCKVRSNSLIFPMIFKRFLKVGYCVKIYFQISFKMVFKNSFIVNTMNASRFKRFYNLIFKICFKTRWLSFQKCFKKPANGTKTVNNHSIMSKHH